MWCETPHLRSLDSCECNVCSENLMLDAVTVQISITSCIKYSVYRRRTS